MQFLFLFERERSQGSFTFYIKIKESNENTTIKKSWSGITRICILLILLLYTESWGKELFTKISVGIFESRVSHCANWSVENIKCIVQKLNHFTIFRNKYYTVDSDTIISLPNSTLTQKKQSWEVRIRDDEKCIKIKCRTMPSGIQNKCIPCCIYVTVRQISDLTRSKKGDNDKRIRLSHQSSATHWGE